MSSQVYIVRDDKGGQDMTLGPQAWDIQTGNQTFGGIHTWPDFAFEQGAPGGWMSFSFDGTELRIWGTTAKASQDFQVSIDESGPYSTSTTDTSPQNYMQWYQSPVLQEGTHSMNVSGIRATATDLFLITPGLNTALQTPSGSSTLLVDDEYGGIKYIGKGWKTTNQKFARSAIVNAQPLLNGTHRTTSAGDGLRFAFTGTRTQIFGMLLGQFATSAPLSISYTIDDGTPTNATLVYQRPGLSGPSAVENASVLDQLNVPLLDTGVLKAGAHSVELHLQPAETGSQPPLIVDYILYQPSFDSIASMPDVTRLLNSPRAKVDAAGGKTTPVGAIVGGVFGCLGAVILLTLSFCLWRRRRSQRGRLHSVEAPSLTPFQGPNQARPSSSYSTTMDAHSPPSLNVIIPGNRNRSNSDRDEKGDPAMMGLHWAQSGHSDSPYDSQTQTSVTPMTAGPGSTTMRRDEIQRRLQELQMLVTTSEMQEAGGLSPLTLISPGGSRVGDTEDLRRRIALLEAENARLTELSAPPPY